MLVGHLEEVPAELVDWALSIAPARVVEFLGLLLVNFEDEPVVQVVGLPREKLVAIRGLVDDWLARRPPELHPTQATAAPRELASLLGKLVFCCDVNPGGRTCVSQMASGEISSGGGVPSSMRIVGRCTTAVLERRRS
mmetsp:Transcript_7512/g.16460  ORF Transcript_7512/g.16460 Transcript_7512/m.16460 type:complete len:138 (-) Transcript_7512:220-633(-)